MSQKGFFQQLRDELHNHPFRDRLLEELEDHAEDLEEENLSKENWNKRMGRPREIKKTLNYALNMKLKLLILFLYIFSLYILFFIWNFAINAILVPWDVAIIRPPEGSLSQIFNDFFESGWGAYLPYIALFSISFLILYLRIKKKGDIFAFQIMEYNAITNFLYVGLLIAFFIIYQKVAPDQIQTAYNPTAIALNFGGIAVLFYMQYTGFTLNKSLKS